MVKIHLHKQQLPEGIVHVDELASVDRFRLGLIAQNLDSVESVNELMGRSFYEDKIDILDHQTNTALHVMNNFSHRALLADEVGLGKTIEAGIVLKEFIARKLAKKILILTPATLKYQWQEEMRSKFGEDFIVASDPADYTAHDRIIASIDTAKTDRHATKIKEIFWDLLIVDEAHKLKNSATQNYKLVKSIQKERCLMLTATPLQNSIYELWAVLDLLHPGFLGTKAKFTEQFVADSQGLKIKNKEILHEKLGKIMIRNLRKETGIKFAPRIVKTHLLTYSKEEMEFYTEAIAFFRRQYEEIRDAEKQKALQQEEAEKTEDASEMSEIELKKMAAKYKQKGLLTFMLIMLTRQISSSIQTGIEALKRYKDTVDDPVKEKQLDAIIRRGELLCGDKKIDHLVKLLKKEKDKVIVFTTFIHTQKMIDVELKMHGYSTVIFNGKMNPEEKEAAIKKFKEESQVLICTDAGSEGRNLQFAHILVNFDLPWNPMRIEQRIGRIHRIGQTRDVLIHNLAIKETIEAYILNRLYEKINLFQVSIGEMDMILSELSTKGSFEKTIFDTYMEEDEALAEDLAQAQGKVEEIKEFEKDIFGWGKTNGS